MSRPKGDCERCGIAVMRCKLHKSKEDNKMVCSYCYKKENNKRFKLNREPILPNVNNSTKKTKSSIPEALTEEYSYLMKGEDSIIAKKYDYDSDKLKRLRYGLAETRDRRRSEGKFRAMEINKIKECSAEENKRFLENFKNLGSKN